MKEIILIKEGEIFLKGLNKSNFETTLIRNIKQTLKDFAGLKVIKYQSTIIIEAQDKCNLDHICKKLTKVFGIASFCRALVVEKDFEKIKKQTQIYLSDELKKVETFKVYAKRSDKNFIFNSFEICCKLGEFLLNRFKNLKVDVKNPQLKVNIEIKDYCCYIYSNKQNGAKGMPLSTAGVGLLLLSGGIDSPVAGYVMAKRGLKLNAIHFISPPYTGERALQKVYDIGAKLCQWVYNIPLHIVNITKLQEEIKKNCPENLLTIILRRFMMRIAQNIIYEQNNKGYNIKCMVTGESLGQVASQTLGALNCTDSVCNLPVLRPLIGLDKEEIIDIAKKIGTFKTSILPYEDCCTVFTPPHPKTNPKIEMVKKAEEKLNVNELIKHCVENSQLKILH